MTRRGMRGLLAWVVMSLVAIAACAAPRVIEPSPATLSGTVDFGASRQVQATMSDVATKATVSLIDPVQNKTVATSVTDSSGAFSLTFRGFTPASYPYFLEAVKGLPMGGSPNRVGASAARVRTLVKWTSGTPSSISIGQNTISTTTTALCVIAGLRSSVNQSALISSLTMGTADNTVSPSTPDTFTLSTSNITNVDFHNVNKLVGDAIMYDQDPIAAIALDGSNNFVRLTPPSSLLRLSSDVAAIGGTLTLYGQSFASPAANNRVTFAGGVSAVGTSVSADHSQLTVPVPAGACTGPLSVSLVTGDLAATGGFLRISNAPLAGTRFVGINAGNTSSGDNGGNVRLIAQQPGTTVTFRSLLSTGAIDYSQVRSLPLAGSTWEINVLADRVSGFQILSDKPVFAFYDDVDGAHGSDDEWACQTGTDYYFRTSGTYGGYSLISHQAGNAVTITCLTDSALNATLNLGAGEAYGRTTVPAAASSYWFHVTSTYPTTVVCGLFSDNASTQIYSADMKTYYESHYTSGAASLYHLVGLADATSVTVTNLANSTSQSYTLNAGQLATASFGVTGQLRTKVVASQPVGFYVGDYGYGYENNQHASVDRLGSVGKVYNIVSPSGAGTRVYLLSLAGGNVVTLTGGITGTISLNELAWVDAGWLAAQTVLKISATQPVAVITADNALTEFNYTLLPY